MTLTSIPHAIYGKLDDFVFKKKIASSHNLVIPERRIAQEIPHSNSPIFVEFLV